MAGFKARVLSGAVLLLVAGSALYFGGAYLWALLLFLALVGLFEFYRALRPENERGGFKPGVLEVVGYTGCICYYMVIFFTSSERFGFFTVIGTLLVMMLFFVIKYPRYDSSRFMGSFFGFIYVCVTLSFVYMQRMTPDGRKTVWIILISSSVCDIFAYLIGMAIGKHKLVPKLSPKKSIEGAVAGVVGAAAAGYLFGFFTGSDGLLFMLITAVGAVISQFGDLTASVFKRNHNIKDFGKLIPGHGGVLDRIDSIIITAPVVYILYSITVR
ncbi:MAG: phosphatidate cytidylyltransferase [Lachnospiraceae bacterium]|nr:phosphatidate cytidylyltransferase [Lachnospiraceae bacterium]